MSKAVYIRSVIEIFLIDDGPAENTDPEGIKTPLNAAN
jgi:hypothetical protein